MAGEIQDDCVSGWSIFGILVALALTAGFFPGTRTMTTIVSIFVFAYYFVQKKWPGCYDPYAYKENPARTA